MAKPRGPKPDLLKIDMSLKDALKHALTRKKPPGGWPKPDKAQKSKPVGRRKIAQKSPARVVARAGMPHGGVLDMAANPGSESTLPAFSSSSLPPDLTRKELRRVELAVGLVLDNKHRDQLGPTWHLYLRFHAMRTSYGNPWVCGMYPGRRNVEPLTHDILSFLLAVPVRTSERWIARLKHYKYIVVSKVSGGFVVGITKCKEYRGQHEVRELPHPLVWLNGRGRKHATAKSGGMDTAISGGMVIVKSRSNSDL